MFRQSGIFSGTTVGLNRIIKTTQMNKALTKKRFKKEVTENVGLVVIQFKTEWNGACQILAPVYEELAVLYKSNVCFFTVDIDKEKLIARENGIIELPAILFFKNGQVVDHVIGLAPKDVLITKIENALNQNIN